MHKIKRLTKEQNEWLRAYRSTTGFEPMHLAISCDVPYDEDAAPG
jgi:hypothetical protein